MTEPNPAPGGAPTPSPVATPTPTPAPAPAPVVAQPPAPSPTPAPVDPTEVKLTSAQLKERLGESATAAQRAMLKELGFEKPDEIKAALAKLKELETASLTEKEKLEQRIKELEPKATRVDAVTAMLNGLVDTQFKALPENVQRAIDSKANGDPDKRLEMMALFQASGLLNQPAPVPAAPPTPAPAPAPVSISPSPAPAPSGALTKFQEWEAMKARAPMLGDFFYQQNQREIERTRPAS